jgi:hypothetical protein
MTVTEAPASPSPAGGAEAVASQRPKPKGRPQDQELRQAPLGPVLLRDRSIRPPVSIETQIQRNAWLPHFRRKLANKGGHRAQPPLLTRPGVSLS